MCLAALFETLRVSGEGLGEVKEEDRATPGPGDRSTTPHPAASVTKELTTNGSYVPTAAGPKASHGTSLRQKVSPCRAPRPPARQDPHLGGCVHAGPRPAPARLPARPVAC